MRIWRTFAGVCWTGKRFDFDGGAQEVLGRGTESPSHGFAVPAPFRQGGQGDGGTDCHSQCAHWLRNDRFLQGVQWAGDRKGRPYGRIQEAQYKAGRVVREADPYGCVARNAVGRDDVGSELSAASGRGSEVSEWPRSKFPASAVRQRRNFGHRNRVIVPYGARRAYYFDF